MNEKNDNTNDSTVGVFPQKNMTNFNHDQLYEAMRDAVDLLDGMHLPGFLIGETARHAWDNTPMTGEQITFAIRKAEYTDAVKGIIIALRRNATFSDDEIKYSVNDIPVIIKIIKRNYEFLKHLDRKWYNYDEYLFPNPFEKYYKARFIVQ